MCKLPRISILIRCYNAEKWIEETLNSAIAQTYPDKEIIVVNDGSTDNSLNVINKFNLSIVKVINQENKGASVAMNTALSYAQGDFIQYLDADDVLDPRKIEIQMNRIATESPNKIAACAWGRFYDSLKDTKFIKEPVWADMPAIDWLVNSWNGGGMMACHAWLTPRQVAQKAGYWDETPCSNDDGEYFTRVLLNSDGVIFCPNARVYYRSGFPGSWSQKRSYSMIAALYRSLVLCSDNLLKHEDSPRTRKACATLFQRFIYSVYPDYTDLVKQAEMKVKLFGGSDLQVDGGLLFKGISNIFGWKLAKQLQAMRHYVKQKRMMKSSS